jgi:hypothetical protein
MLRVVEKPSEENRQLRETLDEILFARSRSPSESVEPSEPFANAVPTDERLGHHLFISTLRRR